MGLAIDDDLFVGGDARLSVERRQFLFGLETHVALRVEGAAPLDVYRTGDMAAAPCAQVLSRILRRAAAVHQAGVRLVEVGEDVLLVGDRFLVF